MSPVDANAIPDIRAQWAIIGMAIGTLIGGALQFFIQLPSLFGVGFRFRPVLDFSDTGVRQVMRLMGPAVLGTAAVQINVMINNVFASSIEGGVSWLGYAFRLMQLPIGIFGVAIGTATLPAISRFAARDDMPNFRSTLASSLGLVFLLTIPSACGLIVLGRPIISLIYQRGSFSAETTTMVTLALACYAVGLAGYAAIKVLSPAFYAIDDARTPMAISLASIGVNVAASYALMSLFSGLGVTADRPYGYGHAGLALSTSCVALINFLALAFMMKRRIKRLGGSQIFSSFLRILIASALLSLVSYVSYRWISGLLQGRSFGARVMEAFIPMIAGGVVFLISARILRIQELSQITGILYARLSRGR